MPIATNDVFATGYVYDVKALEHVNKDQNVEEHPEIPERIEKIHSILKKKGYLDRMVHIPSRMAEDSELLYAHTKEHIEFLKKTRTMKKDKLDALVSKLDSIYMNNKSEQVARLSCGGAIDLCKSIWDGKIQNGVAIIRPPGHHAEANRARGFCLYNNVAVAARCLQRKRDAKKIMILDWDIHHGNGIQDIFYDDPDILYISIHRYDGGKFYPFAKDADMNFVGTGNAIGRNINIPWPCGGMGDSEYMYTFFKLIMPIAFEFSPDMVIISAGFDASKDDLLGGCKVSPECFAHMTHMLKSLGGGKLALILEGGYNVDATAVAMSACVGALLNESLPRLKSVVPIDCAYETIQEVLKVQSRYWSSIAPIYMKPSNEIKLRNKYSKITLSDLIKEHRRNKLYKEYNLIPLPINNDKLSESFKGDIMTSPQALVHEGFLYVFIHNSSDVRVEMNSFENLAESDKSYVFDFGLSYLKEIIPSVTDIASNKYTKKSENAIIEVVINYYEMLKNDRKQATEGIIKYIWDNYIESSLAGKNGKVILIVTGDSVSYISSLIMDRDVEKSVLGTVLFPWIEGPPHISSRKSKWYLNSSLVAIPHLLPPRTKIPTSPQYGHCISYGNDMLDSNEAPIKLQSVVMNFIESKKEEYWRNHRTEYNIFRKNEKVYNDSSISLLNKIDSMNIDLSMLDSSNSLVENVIDLTINEQRNKKIKISQNEHIDISTSDTVLSNNEMEHQGELEHDHFSKHKNKIESKKRLHSNRESSSIIELFINKKETKIGTARIKAASLDLKPLTIDSSDSESDSDADIVEVVLNNKKEQSEKLQEHKIPPSQLFEIPLISSHNKSTQIIHSLEKTPKNKYNKQNEKSESVLKPESSYLLSTNKDSYSKKENQLINTNKLSNASNISYTITYNKSSNMLNNSNNNKQTNQQADLLKTLAINKLSNTLSTTNINNIQNSLNHSVINKQSNIPQTILNSLNTNKQPNTIDKSMNILNSENTNELSNTLKSSNITKPLNTINSSTINKSLNFTNNKSSQVSDNSNVNIQTSAFNGLSFNKTLLNTFEVSKNEDLIKRKVSNFNPNNASPILNINESSSNMMNKDYIHNNSNIYTDIIKSAISGFSNSSNLSNSSSISGDKTFTIDKNNNDDSNINNSNKNNDNNSNRNNNSSETFYGNINSNNNYNGNNSNNNNWNNNRYYDNLT